MNHSPKKNGKTLSFPITLLEKAFLPTHDGSLRPMLKLAFKCHIGLMEKRLPEWKKQKKSFENRVASYYYIDKYTTFSLNWVKGLMGNSDEKSFLESCKGLYTQYSKRESVPYTVISTKVFCDFHDNDSEKTDFEKITLIAYLAMRSIIGDRIGARVKWEFLLSRMCGQLRMTPIEELPDAVQKYNSRKLKDKLRNALIKKWKVQYYFKGRSPWFSIYPTKEYVLKDWVEKYGTPLERTHI